MGQRGCPAFGGTAVLIVNVGWGVRLFKRLLAFKGEAMNGSGEESAICVMGNRKELTT